MASIGEIRAALKETLETAISGIHVHDKMVGIVNVPAVVVQPVEADFEVAMGRGLDAWNFDLIVLASKADERTSQERLDELVDGGGDKSVRKAVFSNNTLGLPSTNAHISGMSGYNGQYTVGSFTYAGATLHLAVRTKPS